jgi:hypothetical protein
MQLVANVADMDDELLMKHLEFRHASDLRMSFETEPDRTERRLAAPKEWRTYHDTLHRLSPNGYDHEHEE